MRRFALLAVVTLISLPVLGQNTDIESLSGLQFNFGNPGARSLAMGGAFIGRADDASAAEANPAGLTILRKPEFSIEGRNTLQQQVLTTTGTFPDLQTTAFNNYSNRVEVTFASVVVPVGSSFTVGGYYHEPLRNSGAGSVMPTLDPLTNRLKTDVPVFYLPKGGPPVSQAECRAIVQQTGDPLGCVQVSLKPFVTAVDIRQRTFGVAGAWKLGNFSVGATARYQQFNESSFTFRLTPDFDFDSISVQATAKSQNGSVDVGNEHDITYAAGVRWAPGDKVSFGAVYKKGASFAAPIFEASSSTDFAFVKSADTEFHFPDVWGAGVSVQPIPVLTLNFDAVRVTYSHLVDDFVSTSGDLVPISNNFQIDDVTELHGGVEYFFSTKIPIALRGGYWRDPAHSLEWRGPLNGTEQVAAAILFPKGQAQNHWSVGAGLAWPKFQIDAAYDSSKHYKVGSLSFVTRF